MSERSLKAKRERRIRKCHSKIAYPEFYIQVASRIHKQYKYPCGICSYWHLTSRPSYDKNGNLLYE